MTTRSKGALGILFLSCCVLAPARAAVPIMPLDEVKPGMKGFGRTVFQGTQIEQFDVTVIGVLESFDFEMDMILIRVESGPVVTRNYGVVGGMSGSPIYIDGKMIGALAYGWAFQKEPIAGVTPIEQMLAQYDPNHPVSQAAATRRQTREAERARAQAVAQGLPLQLEGTLRPADGAVDVGGREYQQVMVAANARDAETVHRTHPTAGVLTPVATPLYVKGVGTAGMRTLERFFEPYSIVPMQAGGAAVPADTPVDFSPGAAIAVPVAYGDIELTAVGTMTYRDGDLVLGFGHPFFGFGRVQMPMATAYITAVISSAESSNKMGAAIRHIGTISQDRPTCIGGTMGGRADVIPISYSLTEQDRGTRRQFDVKLARQPQFSEMYTVLMMQMAMQNIAGAYFDGVTNSRLELITRVKKDGQPLVIKRHNSFDSKALSSFGVNPLWDLFMTLTLLRQNPFGEAAVDSVKVDLTFEAARRFANIERIQAGQQVVKAGESFDVTLYLKPYGGESKPLTFPVRVPESAPLGPMLVILVGGNDAFALRPRINPQATPTDVPSMINWLNNTVRNDSVLVELVLPTTGIQISGQRLRDLPEPLFEPLLASQPEGVEQLHDVDEATVPTTDVVAGVAAVVVEVVGEDGRRLKDGKPEYDFRPQVIQPEMNAMPTQMEMAAERTLTAWLGATPATADQTWAIRRPVPSSTALDSLARSWQYYHARLGAGTREPRRATRPFDWLRGSARQATGAAPAAGEPVADEGGGGEGGDEPPDITDQLDLKKPPKMPGWKDVEQLGKGPLTGEEPAAEEGGEAGSETAGDEGSEEPLARPVSVWTLNSAEDYAAGRFDGTFPIGDGQVGIAPAGKSLGKPESERIWSVLPRPDGSVMVGSWSPKARVHRVRRDGQPEVWLETDDVALLAMAPLQGDAFAVGGIPSGRIYQVTGKGQSKVLADLDEEYIWKLAPDGQGGLYAATGYRGRLYHLDAQGTAKVVLASDERHLLAMCPAPGGGVYVGTYPNGKVYKVVGETVETVYQTDEEPVLALAATPNGNVYVGTAGSGKIVKLDPQGAATELVEVEDGTVFGLTSVGDTVYAATGQPGQLVRIDDEDVTAEPYRTDEPFMLDIAAQGDTALVGTILGSGEVVSLPLRDARRGVYLSPIHDAEMRARWGVLRWRAATTNSARVIMETRSGNTSRPDKGWSAWSASSAASTGALVTSPPARYIQFRATLVGVADDACRLDRVDLFYRTVNRAPTLTIKAPEAGAVEHQKVKIEWEAEDPDEDDLHYDVFYAAAGTQNWTKIEAAEEDEEEPAEDGDGAADPAADEATDDEPANEAEPTVAADGKKVAATLRPAGGRYPARPVLARRPSALASDTAKTAAGDEPAAPKEDAAEGETTAAEGDDEAAKAKEKLSEESLTWDTSDVPDGLYVIKVVAHDEVRNPEDPKSVEKVSKPFQVDNTGPYLVNLTAGPTTPPKVIAIGEDGTYLSSAEARIDDGEWKALVPTDGIFDGRFEELACPALPTEPGEHSVTIRVRDSVGNLSKFQWTFTVK